MMIEKQIVRPCLKQEADHRTSEFLGPEVEFIRPEQQTRLALFREANRVPRR